MYGPAKMNGLPKSGRSRTVVDEFQDRSLYIFEPSRLRHDPPFISRLNSGNFYIFYSRESILIINSSIVEFLKSLRTGLKSAHFHGVLKDKIHILNFCVGKSEGVLLS